MSSLNVLSKSLSRLSLLARLRTTTTNSRSVVVVVGVSSQRRLVVAAKEQPQQPQRRGLSSSSSSSSSSSGGGRGRGGPPNFGRGRGGGLGSSGAAAAAGSNHNNDPKKKKSDAADLFGLELDDDLDDNDRNNNFDSLDNTTNNNVDNHKNNFSSELGPRSSWPPQYKRDVTTGQLRMDQRMEQEEELSHRHRRLLQSDSLEKDEFVSQSNERQWRRRQQQAAQAAAKKDDKDNNDDGTDLLDDLGSRIRETETSLTVLGRSVEAQRTVERLDDGSTLGMDDTGFSQPLTRSELATFRAFMEKSYNVTVAEDDLPVQEKKSSQWASDLVEPDSAEDPDRSLQWLSLRAQRQMDDLAQDDNPYADLVPGDFAPTRLVNRRRAKLIPRELLHHNNVELLRYFVSPTGQIKNRVQTRLGAKDQRKIAKLIKRARAMGLIPHVGQFKVEHNGWIHAPDINRNRYWEKELIRRGLVVQRNNPVTSSGSSSSSSSNDA